MLLVISLLKMRPASLIFESEGRSATVLNQNQKYLFICIDLHKISTFHAFGDQFAWNATCVPHFWKWGTQAIVLNQNQKYLLFV
jgi:hypothetical protein